MFLEDFMNLLYFLEFELTFSGFLLLLEMSISLRLFLFVFVHSLTETCTQMHCWFRASCSSAAFSLLFCPLVIHRKAAHFPTSQAPFHHGKHDGRREKINISIILKVNTLGKCIKLFCASTEKRKRSWMSLWVRVPGDGSAWRTAEIFRSHPSGLSTPDFRHWKWDEVFL